MSNSDGQDIESAIQEILAQNARKKEADAEETGSAEPGDADAASPEATQPQAADTDQIAALTAERDALKDKFIRALADAENARKRSERDRKEAEQYGGSRLARDLLPVYDNLQRALAAVPEERPESTDALIEGVELTLRELSNVFKKHGIEIIDPAAGDKFDPQMHEAMFEAPAPGTSAGEIIQVMTVGFMLHDRLLRPAQVGVSSNPGN